MPAIGAASRSRCLSRFFSSNWSATVLRASWICGICSAARRSRAACCRRLSSCTRYASPLPFELGDLQIDVGAVELGKLLAGGDLLARRHVERENLAGHLDVDRLAQDLAGSVGIAGLDFQRADHAVRQRQQQGRQQQSHHHAQAGIKTRFFHLFEPPRHIKELGHLP